MITMKRIFGKICRPLCCKRLAPVVVTRFPYICQNRETNTGSNTRGDLGRRAYPGEEDLILDEELAEKDNEGIYDREYVDMKVDDFKSLYRDDENIRTRIEVILNEYEHSKYESIGRVPSVITIEGMKILIEEGTTISFRNKIFNYLFKREMAKKQHQRRRTRDKEATKKRLEKRFEEIGSDGKRTGLLSNEGSLLYGLWHNTLFSRIPDGLLKSGLAYSRLRVAAQFGRKIVFDFGFNDYMNNYTMRNSVEQVQEAYGLNKFDYREPLDFWFCNYDKDSFMGQYCETKTMQNLHSYKSMITVKPDCMTNYFDKSRLVYLSPNAKEPLGQIGRSDDIYIIGVYNDKGNSQPVSLRKANKLGIRAKCLPIDEHLFWQGPNKALCINHVVGILLEVMSNGGDWHAAFKKHIPPRKIKAPELVIEEEQRRQERIKTLVRKNKTKSFSLRSDFD